MQISKRYIQQRGAKNFTIIARGKEKIKGKKARFTKEISFLCGGLCQVNFSSSYMDSNIR